METLNNSFITTKDYPVKVLQFGEGNFLRGFVNWMINKTNDSGLFSGKVSVIQPLDNGLIDMLNNQDGLYTLISRGLNKGEVVRNKEIISCIEKGINPYRDYTDFIESADLPELRFIISNTTEAGIAYSQGENLGDTPQKSYPGKLTALLYRRFKTFNGANDKGLIIIPCELIDRNGDNLKKIVFTLAKEWNLENEFITWLEESNAFLNSLVDRIVTGYPREEIAELEQELGYKDNLINTCEVFNLWVIEGDSKYSKELPLHEAGCNVVWTNDMTPYRTRKVRILNGVHTMVCMAAYLYGIETVRECLEDETINGFIKKGLYEEIIPAVDFNKEELVSFAQDVMERFANPFIEHKLLSITLNSVSKYKARVLPTVIDYIKKYNNAPSTLLCSMASLFHFYKGVKPTGETYSVSDDKEIIDKFNNLWAKLDNNEINSQTFVTSILSYNSFWGQDLTLLPLLKEKVLFYFNKIKNDGIEKTIKELV